MSYVLRTGIKNVESLPFNPGSRPSKIGVRVHGWVHFSICILLLGSNLGSCVWLVLGRVAPTSFMILVQLNLDQELNRVHAELCCTKLNLDQLIPFS